MSTPIAAVFAALALLLVPAGAAAEGKFKQGIKQDVRQKAEMEADASGTEMPLPSRDTLARSNLPGPAKCALLCARSMQDCTTRCKGNSSCSNSCYKDYGACAQRCGGPIGTDRGGNDGGGQDSPSGCQSGCLSEMNGCKSGCGGKQPCVSKCMEQMSRCSSVCQ
jgi:hypothetical protein